VCTVLGGQQLRRGQQHAPRCLHMVVVSLCEVREVGGRVRLGWGPVYSRDGSLYRAPACAAAHVQTCGGCEGRSYPQRWMYSDGCGWGVGTFTCTYCRHMCLHRGDGLGVGVWRWVCCLVELSSMLGDYLLKVRPSKLWEMRQGVAWPKPVKALGHSRVNNSQLQPWQLQGQVLTGVRVIDRSERKGMI
jgi:hypothetical protein